MFEIPIHEHRRLAGHLRMKSTRLSRLAGIRPGAVSIVSNHDCRGAFVARFIEQIYRQSYAASISVRYPCLISVCDEDGEIIAAMGFRYAADEPLFLEQYTQQSIEKLLRSRRADIVEIGNLASTGNGTSIVLFAALAAYLDTRGISHAVATGTGKLEKHLNVFGLQIRRLCRAEPSLLHSRSEDWGSYYESDPFVLAGRVDRGYRRLRDALDMRFVDVSRSRLSIPVVSLEATI